MDKKLKECRRALKWRFRPASDLISDEEYRNQWSEFNARTFNVPYMDGEAMAAALAVYGRGDETLAIGTIGDRTVSLLVLRSRRAHRWSTFQPSQLPLGACLIDRGLSLEDMADSLMRALPGFVLVLSLTQIDPLFISRPTDAPALLAENYIDTGWIDLSGSFEDYWNARSKNLRQNLRKHRNKLASEGIVATLQTLTDTGEMQGAVARYGALESAGWKAQHGTAVHPENEQGLFYTRLLEAASSHGEAVVFEYWFNDELAASNLCLRSGHTLYVLKTTFSESHARFSPAFLLRLAEIEAFCATRDIEKIELCGRMREWHERWTEHRRTLYHATKYRLSWLKRLALLHRERTSRRIKDHVTSSSGSDSVAEPVSPGSQSAASA